MKGRSQGVRVKKREEWRDGRGREKEKVVISHYARGIYPKTPRGYPKP